MATEILRPNAAGDECNIPHQTGAVCPNHYQNVDEEVSDGISTEVFTYYGESVWDRDLYNIADSGVGAGTINFIKVYVNCKATLTPVQTCLKIAIKTGGVAYEGSEITNLTGSYALYSNQWNTNPGNGAWTWEQIDALQIGLNIRQPKANAEVRCTQVYVEIDYTEAGVGRSFGFIIG